MGDSAEDLELMRRIDEQYTRTPFYGSRRMAFVLSKPGKKVNRKRVQRLMQRMGLEAIYPKPRLSDPAPGHRIYPYLLRDCSRDRNAKTRDINAISIVDLLFKADFSSKVDLSPTASSIRATGKFQHYTRREVNEEELRTWREVFDC